MKTYLRHRVSNVVDVKELIALEHLDFEGKYKGYSEKHDFWEFCYVEKGEITLTVDGAKHTLSSNELFVIPPNSIHSYFSESGNKSRVFVTCFESFSHNLIPLSNNAFSLDKTEIECVKRIIAESLDTFVTNKDEQLDIKPDAAFGGQQALLLQLEYLLICLLRHLSEKTEFTVVFVNDENFYRELTDAIKRYVRENINKRITLADICDKFSYSQSFICKVFKKQTGQTLIEYVNHVKVTEACKLLSKSSMTISEISASLGFQEHKYFDALFKKNIGKTPSLYRKENEHDKSN